MRRDLDGENPNKRIRIIDFAGPCFEYAEPHMAQRQSEP